MVHFLAEKHLFCTACAACANACPVNAIDLEEDCYGFRQAVISPVRCIHCKKCESVCPVLHEKQKRNEVAPACYAVMASDAIRFKSSSGGAFPVLAKKILAGGGMVSGAAMMPDLTVRHCLIESEHELDALQKSKYVQSDIQLIYRKIQTALNQKKKVLFSGCPCQAAGLKAFLGENSPYLYTIDILCHGIPSQKMLKESLSETIGKEIRTVDFRDKNYGWECLGMTVELKNGAKRRLSYDESRYEQGFHPGMTLRDSCYDCKFCDFPREGDISIGDFWQIEKYKKELNDNKGTSFVLINSEKGRELFEQVRACFQRCEQVPLKYTKHNRITAKITPDPGRDYFKTLYPAHTFNTAVLYAQQDKYDIGLVGNWSFPNYGSELTYYALYTVLKEMGASVLMISWPQSSKWKPYPVPQLFRTNPYKSHEIGKLPSSREELYQFNEKCNTFLLGSDQLLNNNLYNWFNKFMQLDWVRSDKRKIAYAASFGCDYIWGSEEDRAELSYFLQDFDFFSVREKSGVKLAKTYYGVDAKQVLDPIFLVKKELFIRLAESGEQTEIDANYLFTYVLDVTPEKEKILNLFSSHMNLKLSAALDGDREHNSGKYAWNIPTVYDLKIEDWLSYIKNCSFMVTDSFHGMCFAILFHKQFIAIGNDGRGNTRFESILALLGLSDRLVYSEKELDAVLRGELPSIDYQSIDLKLETLITESRNWLQRALNQELPPKALSPLDFLARSERKIKKHLDEHQQQEQNTMQELRLQIEREQTTDQKQWEQLEDHRLRLDGIDAKLQEDLSSRQDQEQLLEAHQSQLEGLERIKKQQQEQMDTMQVMTNQLAERLDRLEHSYSYRIGRIITYLPRKIRDFFASEK